MQVFDGVLAWWTTEFAIFVISNAYCYRAEESDEEPLVYDFNEVLSDAGTEFSDISTVVCEISDASSLPKKPKMKKTYRKRGSVPPKQWHCPLCPGLVFRKKRDQVLHVRSLHGQLKPYVCEECAKEFPVSLPILRSLRGMM